MQEHDLDPCRHPGAYHLRIIQVDVFSRVALAGNPAAVVLDADILDGERMLAIARETNLSETTFVLPPTVPGADYRVRIFTPRAELPFAGHPTIATVAALLEAGRLGPPSPTRTVRQECGVGIVEVGVDARPDGPFFEIALPPPVWSPAGLDAAACARMLGCATGDLAPPPAEVAATGVPWLVVALGTVGAVRALAPDLRSVAECARGANAVGVTVFAAAAETPGCAFHVRSFAPGAGIAEDPVCGSGNGAVGAFAARHGLVPSPSFAYVAEQGAEVLRPGRVSVRGLLGATGWRLWIGGQAVVVMEGTLRLASVPA
jgi:PhzF family phenazine biosynthesis protein